jgi:predicted nucleotidyltransferase
MLKIALPQEQIAAFCRRHHIVKLSIFGSVIHDDFESDSDIDVLVEFDSDHIPGFAFVGMQRELSEILGREVDLHTPQSLSRYFREAVIQEAHVQYVRPS